MAPPSKRAKVDKSPQKTLDLFFKPAASSKTAVTASTSSSISKPSSLTASLQAQVESDAAFALQLSQEGSSSWKGSGKAVNQSIVIDDSDDIVCLTPPVIKQAAKVHPMFSSQKDKGKGLSTPAPGPNPMKDPVPQGLFGSPKPRAETTKVIKLNLSSSASADGPEHPLDLDVFIFDPALVPISSWPAGRVPYAFITSAFVLIVATKSVSSYSAIEPSILTDPPTCISD